MERGTERARRRRQLEQRRAPDGITADLTLDTVGLYCPVPIIRTREAIESLSPGAVIEIRADDRVILIDMPAWCLSTGHEYLGFTPCDAEWRLFVRKR